MTPTKSLRKPDPKSPPSIAARGSTKKNATDSTTRQPTRTFPIVGIGASAGGLEAFTALLKALPPNLNMAFILVPHLDPSRESAFTQILSRTTQMPVLEAQDGLQVAPNHVYVIPPKCELRISDGTLRLADRHEPRLVNTTIDVFLRSLAEAHGSNAIGIVLSGTASDGTIGLAAVKSEGGITFAQDSGSAKYDGMPASAIAAGCVDFVLPPEAIARELARIRKHPYVTGSPLHETRPGGAASDVQMGQIFRLLRRATKVDFSEYKPPTIARRIHRRMVLHKIHKLSEYISLLHQDRNEVHALYQDLLINVTSFFRNPEAFDILKELVYPAILQTRTSPSMPIRIWVPGCSTGEETYSHAISLVEYLGEERSEVPIQIFGTDLSEAAIRQARSGIYKESIEADLTPQRLRRFFHKTDGTYQISKTIRDLCIFSTQNIFGDPPFSRLDLVSCRNVMIYLGQSLQKKVIPIFHYALKPTGFLMIGSTEGLLGAGSDLFDMADKRQKIYRKKLVATPVMSGFAMVPGNGDADAELPLPPPRPADGVRVPPELQREADRLLLAKYAPPAVVVNEQLDILQTRGHTGRFLELPGGKASLNLMKMARPSLLFELQSAIEQARKTSAETVRRAATAENNGNPSLLTIRVVPFKAPLQSEFSFLIAFEPPVPDAAPGAVGPAQSGDGTPLTENERQARDQEIAYLKQELGATREYLQSIIETHETTNEELQSANEEIQSANEELQSTNEELQTSKEELESANEELHTVNEEMQHRNELLTQLNNDLTNLLNSVNLPLVLVGADLSVRRFNPQAATVLGFMANDIGRPVPRLKLKIDVNYLEQMMLDVMQQVQPRQFELQDNQGRWCNFRVTPYRTMDNRIDGVVLSVVDIDDLRKKENSRGKTAAKTALKKSKRK